MFDNDSEKLADPGAARHRIDWSQLRGRLGLAAIALLLFGVAGLVLTVGVRWYLAAVADPTPPTAAITNAAVARRAAPAPVAMVAIRTAGTPLNERSGPSTYDPIRGHLADGATIAVVCQVFGEKLVGPVATSALWEVDSHGLYLSDAYLTWNPARPVMRWCGVNSLKPVTATAHVGVDGLSIRAGASVDAPKVGTKPDGTVLNVICHSWGGTVSGVEGSTATWSELADGQFVSDAYVHWSPEQPSMPWCGEAPRAVPPATVQQFIAQAVAPAQADMAKYGVPASVTLAQAILESGSGASTLTQVDHAVFGMKCFGDPGSVAVGCRNYATHECDAKGKCYSTNASFRAYRTEADSFTDHAILLATTARYQPTRAYTDDPDNFAKALQKAGYATSPKYATNLISVMQRYNLYQYDRHPVVPACPPVAPPATVPSPSIQLPGTRGAITPAALAVSLVTKPTCN